ncbi:MAG TPA: isoprenylcysteine carboxylmethyltransferase family protein [Longimicrobium sp.]|jgi:protein-S-isoprenylcysteine O-methyltransferase Ste14
MVWLRTLFFALAFVATMFVLLPLQLAGPGAVRGIGAGPLAIAGALLTAGGLALAAWCWWDFTVRGRGTPAPFDPPRALVVSGPYRYVRNPMYLGAGAILLGEAALLRAPVLLLYGLVFVLAVHAFVVLYEERTLGRRFGADYEAYRAAVPRWLPRLRPYREPERPAA